MEKTAANIKAVYSPRVDVKSLLEKEKDLLLTLSNEIAYIQDKDELLPILQHHLTGTGFSDDFAINILHKDRKAFSRFIVDSKQERTSRKDHNSLANVQYPFPDGFFEIVMESKTPIIFNLQDLMKKKVVPNYIPFLYDNGIREMLSVALIDRGKDIGGFFIFSDSLRNYTEQQLKLVKGISNQVAASVSNIMANEENKQRENEKSMLLSLSSDIASCRTKEDVENIVKMRLVEFFQFNEIMICLNNDDNITHTCYIHSVSKESMSHPDFARGANLKYFINDGIFNIIEESKVPVIFDMEELVSRTNKPFYINFWNQLNAKEIIGFPLRMNDKCIGGATLYPKIKNSFSESQLNLISAVFSYIGIALSNIKSYEKIRIQLDEINKFKSRLEQEKHYLQEQIKSDYNYDEIAGKNNGMREVFRLVSSVTHSDCTVLIQGETGTGKELVARAIHNSSSRKNNLMIKVNCATLPANLAESELFGHERGSFTGAFERRIGKFELANNSTLFLDEIGELTPELQVKLLRAIQEKEIERIGGKEVIKTNIRIIAATNRNLHEEVEEGRFRRDLFYRLNVFPITLPSLKNRREDIPKLVTYFIDKYAKGTGKNITGISSKAIEEMMLYNWPGNVRELEHVIERSLLMTTGDIITEIYLPKNNIRAMPAEIDLPTKSLEENERDYILAVLKMTNGKVRGDGGAAEFLKIPPSTLNSKIKKLAIKKENIFTA
jgi:formate hydrogenlyase transcriptional activator